VAAQIEGASPGATAADERVRRIQRALLDWYASNARDLPWRWTRDPYAILVSEVMLQQTQVDRVIPYYQQFLERFPAVQSLAKAPTSEVIRIWSGLGYNRRAVNLQRAAQAVVERFGGSFPSQPEILRTLPGIGAYTAGAIAAFAFERDVAFLDTNMRRVVSRVQFGAESPADPNVLAAAKSLVPAGQGWAWNQALIEFGALQCTARRPACIVCPLREECVAYPSMQTAIRAQQRNARRLKREPFETSSRYYRGRIVEVLRGLPEDDGEGIALAQLGAKVRDGFVPENLPWLRELVVGLARDGLAVIAETAPVYDIDAPTEGSSTRVRLP
jgi:A/G-specific adenine glycosylase